MSSRSTLPSIAAPLRPPRRKTDRTPHVATSASSVASDAESVLNSSIRSSEAPRSRSRQNAFERSQSELSSSSTNRSRSSSFIPQTSETDAGSTIIENRRKIDATATSGESQSSFSSSRSLPPRTIPEKYVRSRVSSNRSLANQSAVFSSDRNSSSESLPSKSTSGATSSSSTEMNSNVSETTRESLSTTQTSSTDTALNSMETTDGRESTIQHSRSPDLSDPLSPIILAASGKKLRPGVRLAVDTTKKSVDSFEGELPPLPKTPVPKSPIGLSNPEVGNKGKKSDKIKVACLSIGQSLTVAEADILKAEITPVGRKTPTSARASSPIPVNDYPDDATVNNLTPHAQEIGAKEDDEGADLRALLSSSAAVAGRKKKTSNLEIAYARAAENSIAPVLESDPDVLFVDALFPPTVPLLSPYASSYTSISSFVSFYSPVSTPIARLFSVVGTLAVLATFDGGSEGEGLDRLGKWWRSGNKISSVGAVRWWRRRSGRVKRVAGFLAVICRCAAWINQEYNATATTGACISYICSITMLPVDDRLYESQMGLFGGIYGDKNWLEIDETQAAYRNSQVHE
ncbi:hypothetical protein HDU83_003305 [Entophlyctis luteolus]|nr:hypothetical protein HDU83_003305 [Entophlyctis luteolus]